MICPISSRLKSMESIIAEFQKIEDWEHRARVLPMSPEGVARIEALHAQVTEARRVAHENTSARQVEAANLRTICDGFQVWLKGELEKVSAYIAGGGVFNCSVGELPKSRNSEPSPAFTVLTGFELRIADPANTLDPQHILQIILTQQKKTTFTVRTGIGAAPPSIKPPQDPILMMIPMYRQRRAASRPSRIGFFTRKTLIGEKYGTDQLRELRQKAVQARPPHLLPVTATFHVSASLHTKFAGSEWPANEENLRQGISDAIDAYVAFIASGSAGIAP